MRAALYARYSTDQQNPRSIGDQVHAGHRYAEKIGATVVRTFDDAAISAAAMSNRPGMTALMQAAANGEFDVVIAEELSRLTRDGGHSWDIFYDLSALGVEINTIAEGRVDELAIGLKGTMNALERKATGARVRRGLSGVARDGRAPGGISYGYRVKKEYDAKGEPIRGLREIDPEQAGIVRRIFAEFNAGSTAHQIARRLNAERIPGPKGGHWTADSIAGAPSRPSGTLQNHLYKGEIVWGRKTWSKDRRSGKYRSRAGDKADVVRQPAPDLAIVDTEAWDAAQRRLAEIRAAVALAANPSAANAPKRLLSGLVKCGSCGATMKTVGADHRYRCTTRKNGGPTACPNSRGALADRLETEVLDELRRDLLHPEVIEAVIQEYRTAQAKKAKIGQSRRQVVERELGEVKRRAERLLNMPPELLSGPSVAGKLKELDTRRIALEAELAMELTKARVVPLHPNAAGLYRTLVEDLRRQLRGGGTAERDAARVALRKVVRAVVIHPEEGAGKYRVQIDGDLTGLIPMIAARRKAGG